MISNAEKMALPNFALNAYGSRLMIARLRKASCFIWILKGAICPRLPARDMSSSGIYSLASSSVTACLCSLSYLASSLPILLSSSSFLG